MAKSGYQHFCLKDRVILQGALEDGVERPADIAQLLGKSTQTIRNEFHNSGLSKNNYKAIDAQLLAIR